MLVIGLTGGIGSGKTAVSDHFKYLGIDIVDADVVSREVVDIGTPALKEITKHFGKDILLPDHSLDRAALRKRIFSDPTAKQWLEKLLHPLIQQRISQQLKEATSAYVIFVSPLLIEANQKHNCNRLLIVDVPENIQLERTIERDNNDEDQVKRIIASQATRKQRLDQADDIIENTGSLKELQDQIKTLHQQYLELAMNSKEHS
jgi:dephospho-CoA kinase